MNPSSLPEIVENVYYISNQISRMLIVVAKMSAQEEKLPV